MATTPPPRRDTFPLTERDVVLKRANSSQPGPSSQFGGAAQCPQGREYLSVAFPGEFAEEDGVRSGDESDCSDLEDRFQPKKPSMELRDVGGDCSEDETDGLLRGKGSGKNTHKSLLALYKLHRKEQRKADGGCCGGFCIRVYFVVVLSLALLGFFAHLIYCDYSTHVVEVGDFCRMQYCIRCQYVSWCIRVQNPSDVHSPPTGTIEGKLQNENQSQSCVLYTEVCRKTKIAYLHDACRIVAVDQMWRYTRLVDARCGGTRFFFFLGDHLIICPYVEHIVACSCWAWGVLVRYKFYF